MQVFFRTVILYLAVLFMMRLMGKREIGQLSLFDLVVAIMIAELAAIPMEDTSIPLHMGLLPIATLVAAEIVLSYISLKSQKARAFIEGTPSIIIERGRILSDEMKKLRYSMTDLISQLREKDVANIEDVEYAILETNGKLSVILKSDRRPLTPRDLNIKPSYEGIPTPLILDGVIQVEGLKRINKDEKWLRDAVSKYGYKTEDIIFAHQDENGSIFLCPKHVEKE
ncbi:DUF421 domain-containing protein [Anaerobranca gottschalkii]|uniref:Uncharacterized membrane protein YcaP, DUF421 family n=1 Tax=Anaerobranca gottschalkii DSM 13577 TaxID=1120990 RepID=A0A1H9YUB5_9FIRM|nr:DUF421 domain-containing protein [Anaerobranca gottschalkii]SES72726.1 Uncharacterized membrane protein YcaP, DUF421 family [Anaerobranca gottschalkii DSM 13577]